MKTKINLYVDDLRDCPTGFTIARTAEIALYYLDNFDVGILSLDHDLGENYRTGELLPSGQDFVKTLCEYSNEKGWNIDEVYIHTDNNVGREAMFKTLLAAQRRGFIDEQMKIYHYPIVPNSYTLSDTDIRTQEVEVPYSFLVQQAEKVIIPPDLSESRVKVLNLLPKKSVVSISRETLSLFI